MKIGMVAGEASGDIIGAGLIKSIRLLHPDCVATGVGGAKMIRENFQSLYEMERLSVMGLIEPLFHLRDLFTIRHGLKKFFLQNKPDVFVGIDSPDFNLGLEIKLRQAGIPIVHYVSPSVWAWRQKRVVKIKKAVDLMLTLFPFEADFYRKHDVPVRFVGHPLADIIPLVPDKIASRKKLQLDEDAQYIAIMPGSRRNEIKYLAETFIKTAMLCWKKKPEIRFITSAINNTRNQEFQEHCKRIAPNLPIKFFIGSSYDVLAAADCVLVTSGTATLETMLFKKPMVIGYKMAGLTYAIGRRLIKLKHIGLPNLLADELLVPEFIQNEAEPEKMSAAVLDFLNHPEKMAKLENKFLEIHHQLRQNANETAAQAINDIISARK